MNLAKHVEHELQIWHEKDTDITSAYILYCDTCDEPIVVENESDAP